MPLAGNLRNKATFFSRGTGKSAKQKSFQRERERANGEWQSCVLRERFLLSAFQNSLSCKEERERDLSFSLFLKWVVSSSSCYKTHLKQEKNFTVFLYLCNVLISKKKRLFWGVFICISLVLLSNFDGMVNGFWRTFGELIIWRKGF